MQPRRKLLRSRVNRAGRSRPAFSLVNGITAVSSPLAQNLVRSIAIVLSSAMRDTLSRIIRDPRML